jgi:hypothetical protein
MVAKHGGCIDHPGVGYIDRKCPTVSDIKGVLDTNLGEKRLTGIKLDLIVGGSTSSNTATIKGSRLPAAIGRYGIQRSLFRVAIIIL